MSWWTVYVIASIIGAYYYFDIGTFFSTKYQIPAERVSPKDMGPLD